ncbi:MAG: peptidase, partial [Burkholderiales bacterium]|nr:peptidase [Burkholderiales bacterium]
MKRKIFLTLALLSLLSTAFATNTHKRHHHTKHVKRHYIAANKHAIANLPKAKIVHTSPFTATKVVSTIPAENINQYAITHQPKLYSYSAMAVNIDNGEVLVSKNPTAKLPIASITKLMTAMVALDANPNLDSYITISSDDIDKLRNTFSRLKVGMQFKRRDLLLLALMSSENRAAYALGRTAY